MKCQKSKIVYGFVHIFLLLIIATVGIGAIGYFAYRNGQIKIPAEDSTIKNDIAENSNANSTKDWLTYESTLFTFKYPRQLEIGNTRNSVLIFDGPTNEKTSDYYFGLRKTDENSQIGSITKKVINGKPAYVRKITVDNQGYPIDNIWQISIENIEYYKDNKWQKNGNLFIDVHIDENFLDADKISDLIFRSITFRDISDISKPLAFNVDDLEAQIPYTWLYSCHRIVPDSWINRNVFPTIADQIDCIVDTQSNTVPDRPAEFFLKKYFTTDKKIYPFIERNYLKNISIKPVEISGIKGQLLEGTVDPRKYSEGSAVYGQNDKINILEINTPDGLYSFSGVTTEDSLKQSYDQTLSTFKFIDKQCKDSEYLKQCKIGPCCCPIGAMCD